ncbi:MAG: NAD(P)H-hydrate epimerase [Dehalococcoidia bacterium]|nr:NAD(P)H-hydrate epimerase [Dehalococcoidia bacterium]
MPTSSSMRLSGTGWPVRLRASPPPPTELALECGRPILSLDVPTGVDSTTGTVSNPAVHASTTLLLDLPKRGLLEASCQHYVGAMYLADLGIPRGVYDSAGIDTSGIFTEGPIVRVRR